MEIPDVEQIPARSHYNRDRRIVLAIALSILIACLGYTWVAIATASALRRQHALDRNLTTAQLSARLLNEQWDGLVSGLDVLANRASLLASLQRNDLTGVKQDLRYAVDLVSPLLYVAVYRPSGTLVASYLDGHITPVQSISALSPANVASASWFQHVTTTRTIYQSDVMALPDAQHTQVIAAAVPLGRSPHPPGYILAYYHLGDIDAWLQRLHMSGGILYIVRTDGHIVDASGGTSSQRSGIISSPALGRAIQHQEGVLVTDDAHGSGQAIIGYSYAAKPHWAVLVVQPFTTVFASTNYVVSQLFAVGGVFLALLSLAAWTLDRLYRRQNRLTELLVVQNEQLRAADEAKSNFLANVSHDLRTPLASIRLSLSGLLDPDLDWKPEQVRECLRVADEGLDQITARVSNLLEMARLEANAWPQREDVCDLTDLVGAALERMAPLLAHRPVTLRFPAEPILVECDPAQIETVIVNLLDNALKYTEEGSPLSLYGETDDFVATFRLEDRGIGIPEDDKERIFDKFYRSRSHSSADGTGLGLAICNAIIEAHHGCIGVRDAREGGSEFWFSLPLYIAREEHGL